MDDAGRARLGRLGDAPGSALPAPGAGSPGQVSGPSALVDGIAAPAAARDVARSASGVDRPVMARASRALGWSLLNTAVSRLGTLGIGIALARMLGPEEFGTFAVATVALLAVLSFNELGVSLAIVRWPVEPGAIAPTVTTISVATSAAITGCGVAVAPAFAAAMGAPQATPVVQVMMAGVLINGLAATPAALLQREFKQARRMLIDQVNVWLGAVTCIVLAAVGMGAMSLAIGRVAGSVAALVLFKISSPLPYKFGWDRECVRSLLKFGVPLAGASILVFAVGYADQLIAGHRLGAVELGYYVLAVNIAAWPSGVFAQPLRAVAPAAFSALQGERSQMTPSFVAVARGLASVAFPCCFALAGAALPVVRLIYGDAWLPSAGALSLLCMVAAFKILFELAYDYLVVLARSTAVLRLQAVYLTAVIPAMILGANLDGIRGVAAGQVVVACLVMVPIYLLEIRAGGVPTAKLAARVVPPFFVGIVAGAGAWTIARVMTQSWLLASGLSGALAVACGGAMILRCRDDFRSLKRIRREEGTDASACISA